MRIAVAEAKGQPADLLRRVEAGEEVEVIHYGCLVARRIGAGPRPRKPLVGALRGRIAIVPGLDARPADFFDALAAPVGPAKARRLEGSPGSHADPLSRPPST